MTLTSATTMHVHFPVAKKLGFIITLAAATLIPALFVSQLVNERQERETGVQSDIAQAWGPEQRVGSPMLILPVTNTNATHAFFKLGPRQLDIKADVKPETRRRGIFAATVYTASLTMTGTFELPDGFRDGGPNQLKTGDAMIAIRLSSLSGINDNDQIDGGGTPVRWQTCSEVISSDDRCRDAPVLVAPVDLAKAKDDRLTFSLTLHLRGTGAIRFASIAKRFNAQITGSWTSPGFTGTDLPTASTINKQTFDARWTVDKIGKPRYVQAASILDQGAPESFVGVDLVDATPVYRSITRASKYALLIVALAFSTYFLFEVISGISIALFQYGMLAASLSLFTLLLLSISEMLDYTSGFIVSAAMVTAQASLYTLSVTRRWRPAGVFASILGAVFGFLYILLSLETYSLVVGTVALFVVLSIIMSVTQTFLTPSPTSATP